MTRTPSSLPLWVLLLFLLAGIALGSSWGLDIQQRERQRLSAEASHALDEASGQVDAVLALLDAAAGLFAADRDVRPETWRSFIGRSGLPLRFPGVLGMGWSQRVVADAPSAEESEPVQALEPVDQRDQAAIGYDLFANPLLRETMERARDSGAAAASARMVLFTAPAGQVRTGFFLFVPFYRDGGVPGTVEERRATLQGFVFAPCEPEALFAPVQRWALAFELHDGPPLDAGNLIYSQRPGPAGRKAWFFTFTALNVGGHAWSFAFSAPPPADPLVFYAPAWTAALACLLSGLLVAVLMWWLGSRQRALAGRAAGLSVERNAEAEERTRLQATLDALGDGLIATDTGGRIKWINRTGANLTGWSPADASERLLGEVFRIVDGASHENLASPLPSLPATGDGTTALPEQALLMSRVCGEIPVAGTVAPLLDEAARITGFLLAFRNVSASLQAEDERHNRERFGLLADTLPQKVLATDAAGLVNYCNRQIREFSGMAAAELAAQGWLQMVHGDDLEETLGRWRRSLETGDPYFMEHRLRRADGAYLWHLSRAQATRNTARDGWVVAMTDVDDLRRAAEQRNELLDRERLLRTRAEEAGRAREEFLAVLSHELRTPLNAIRGWTQTLLKGDARKEDLVRALTLIEQSAHAQARLIDDLLNMAEIVAGRLRLEIGAVNLVQVVEAVVDSLRPGLAAKSLHLESHLDPAADAMTGDAVRLQQVVWNLLSNAVKFTPDGGEIRVDLERREDFIELAVSDNGEGIATDFLPYVFNRFRQAEPGARDRPGSLGLGLTIARHLVELHGGSVRAESAGPGMGARFTVTLPLLAPRQPESRPFAAEPVVAAGSTPLKGLRVLSVDDDRNTREMLKEALVHAGAEVLSAASAAEALKLLTNTLPDVLVADIGLPGEDGYSLLRRVRALPAGDGGATPAVAITGYARDEDREACLAAGFQAYASKPVGLDELFGLILGVAGK